MLATPTLLERMDEMYNFTEKTGLECIIAIGELGTISNIYHGTADDITEGVNKAILEIGSNGELTNYIIHTHGGVLGKNNAIASEDDRINFIGKTNGIVLGIKYPIEKDDGGYNINNSNSSINNGQQKQKMLNIYNRHNIYDINNAVDYNSFKKSMLKINEKINKK